VPAAALTAHERVYPFAWLGILAATKPSSDELVYARHADGFALHSMRGPAVTRQYLQVPAGTDVADWPDDRIWEHLRRRLARTSADAAFQKREPLTGRGGLVIAWAGMRGVVTLAAAQTIPVGTEHRATLVLTAFIVAVISLVGFGGTLPILIRRLNFAPRTKARNAELSQLMKALGERSVDIVGPMSEITVDGEKLDPELVEWISRRFIPLLMGTTSAMKNRKPDTWERSVIVQRRYLDAMAEALWEERAIGAYSSATYAAAQHLLDREERRVNPIG
jgi:CPA1 family monovalent cation:H+ antiporter